MLPSQFEVVRGEGRFCNRHCAGTFSENINVLYIDYIMQIELK